MDMEYEYNLLLHVDSDDVKTLDLALGNAHHFLSAFTNETIRLVIVVNGPGVKLMTPQYPDQARKAAEMTKKGASILVCGNALKAYNMDNSELWPNVEVVSSGIVEIVRLQDDGMAYVKP
ncbi:DsrE family protein [Oxalobacter formigenes]|uniref:Uncharacterized protein n=1 Tax=Oxalobacter formigenes OXCC13 TaxID=556269 RepID=C3XAZ9_OXAFO|nr:DsrE family protein [Oxalobacter formigenes]ARQ45466.1 DsrE/DsrF-like family protein [Oxalobacter formigenes]ARQ77737.1 hypothetical protein BRW84_03195 [Oxalobacter formigenes OXCC13]EEO30375.1 hypothetical protein OFBG_01403 [Oxalobacter formigenes OXCC13]MCZ4061903.1 DsrE family protein [Oxalobacter formigenes]QDX33725.1 hypothetical protein FPZ51_09210 [Oxalobacter formigenes]